VSCLLRSITLDALELATHSSTSIDSVQKIDAVMSAYYNLAKMRVARSQFYTTWTQGTMTMSEYCNTFELVADELQLLTNSRPLQFILRMRPGSTKDRLCTWFDSNSSSTLSKLKDRAIYFEVNRVIEESLGTPLIAAAISPVVPPNVSIPPMVPVSFGLYAPSYPPPPYWYPLYPMPTPPVTQGVIAVDTDEGFKGS
jgi:hypothetical protein